MQFHRSAFLAFFAAVLFLALASATAQGKGILEILRDKGVISEDEYRQAIEEAQGKDKKVVEEAKAQAKKESKMPSWLERTSVFGDIRFRYEGFHNSDIAANNPDRNRFRVRARLGLGVDVSEELQGRLRLVTGDAGDPISTNQTLTDLFTRKPINLDWVYITVTPGKSFGLDQFFESGKGPLSVTGGKFPVPFFQPPGSELIFDDDLSPEGLSQTLTLWDRSTGFVRNVKLTGAEWNIKEFSNNSATNLFDHSDAWMFGGQAQVQFAPTADSILTLAIADYGFTRLDVVARERNSNGSLLITNNIRRFNGTVAGGSPVSPNSCASPFTAAGCIADFLGGFNILDVGAALDVPTPWKSWPVTLFFHLAHNTEAKTSDDTGIWTGLRIGRAANKGDVRFTYTWARTETDAVPSVFSYSDFGRNGGTNVMGHFLGLEYVLLPRLTLSLKEHLVNFIDRPVGFHNPTQSRLQLNAVLAF
jgi:hypothetical protein